MRLLKRGRKLLRVRDKRALATSSCADTCCDGACANYVKVRWCCDPTREAWTFMNRPDCPGYVDWLGSLSTTDPQVFRLATDPSQTCWSTDPVPEGNIRAYSDIPAGALILPRGVESEIVDGCADDRCGPCPECCGSRFMPTGCGSNSTVPGENVCCECGDNYTLTITETANSRATGTHYADPCTTFPSIGTQPSWESRATHTATFTFGCREVDDGNGGTRLERFVTGRSVLERTRTINYARIVYYFPVDNFDPRPCGLIEFGQGRTVVDTQTFERTWEEAYGGEGCGLTRNFVARLGPENLIPGNLTGMGTGIARFDIFGECFGSDSVSLPVCDNPFSFECQMGIPFSGYNMQWTGSRNCDGGAFTESGTFGGGQSNWSEVTVIQGDTTNPAFDTLWPGGQAGSWEYSVQWNTSGGEACDADPCGQQQPIMLRPKDNIHRLDTKPAKYENLTREQILQRALRGVKGCNCGKR